MSCYAKHPELPGVECWHGPGHEGDHNKENYSWPNADDKYQKEIARLSRDLAEARSLLDDDASWGSGCLAPFAGTRDDERCLNTPLCWEHQRRDFLARTK